MTISRILASDNLKEYADMQYGYDKKAGKVIAIYLCLNMTNIAIKLINSNRLLDFMLNILMFFIFMTSLLVKKHFYITGVKIFIGVGAICALFYGVGFLTLGYINGNYLARIYWTFLFCIPLFAIVADVNDYKIMLQQTEKAAKYCVFCAMPVFIIFLVDKNLLASPDYSMSFGYALLFSTLFFLYQIKRTRGKKKITYFVYCCVCVLMIVSYGSRSPILCIGIYMLSEIFFMRGMKRWKKFILGIATIGCSILLAFEYKMILTVLINLLRRIGVYSRSLGYFLERTTYTGREKVWAAAVEKIMEKPLFGWGFGVDTSIDGFYPHNFYLGLMLQYGIIIGIILGVIITILILKKIYIGKEHNAVLLLFFCCGFLPLLLSSEYLVWPTFWIFLSICLFEHKKRIINLGKEYTLSEDCGHYNDI